MMQNLKSSLDRFIGGGLVKIAFVFRYLKSSLDRFIAVDKTT